MSDGESLLVNMPTLFRRLGAGCLVASLLVACGDDAGSESAAGEPPEENLAVVVFYEGTPMDEQERVVDKCGSLEGVDEVVERPAGEDGPEVGLLQDGSPFQQRLAVTNCLAGEKSVYSVYGEYHPPG